MSLPLLCSSEGGLGFKGPSPMVLVAATQGGSWSPELLLLRSGWQERIGLESVLSPSIPKSWLCVPA